MLKIRRYKDDCRHLRLDANETIFFARQLELVKAQVYPVLYSDRSAFRLFPIDGEGGPGVKVITYRSRDEVGEAKIIASDADDLPQVGLKGREISTNVRLIGASYAWTWDDLQAAMQANLNLSGDLAVAAARAHNRKISDLAWFGDTEHGIDGIQTLATAGDIPQAAATVGAWDTATADEMVADVSGMLTEIISNSGNVHRANVVALPAAKLTKLMTTPRSTGTDMTVAGFLAATWPGVTWETAEELVDWDGSADAMMALERSPQNVQMVIPVPYTELPVQQRGIKYIVPTLSKSGGIVVRYPKAFNIKTGI